MAGIKFISLEELLEKTANKESFKLVEVLPEDSFKQGHIPGAVNLPLEQLSARAGINLKKSDTIIVYCGGYACQASTKAAEALLNMGYKKTLDFKGGKKTWVGAGLELEK